MAQVDIYQYAEVIKSDGTKIKIGSKQKPSTIAMTGTGEIIHRVYNDIAAVTAQTLYDNELGSSIPVWWAILSSQGGTLAWGNDASNSSAISIVANVWQFFGSSRSTTSTSTTIATKAAASLSDIGDIVFYNRSATTAADVEFIVVV
jgi:hypothetical protein